MQVHNSLGCSGDPQQIASVQVDEKHYICLYYEKQYIF